MSKKTSAIIIFLVTVMLAAQLATIVQACAPKRCIYTQPFVLYMEDSIFNYDNARWRYYPTGETGEGPPPSTPPTGALFSVTTGVKSELNPATNNYVRIGETEIQLNPDNYYSTYNAYWTYDAPGASTGRGLYIAYEKFTLDSNGFKGTIEIRATSIDHWNGTNYWGEGTFIGYGKINGETVFVMGKSYTNIVIPHFIIDREGTIMFR